MFSRVLRYPGNVIVLASEAKQDGEIHLNDFRIDLNGKSEHLDSVPYTSLNYCYICLTSDMGAFGLNCRS